MKNIALILLSLFIGYIVASIVAETIARQQAYNTFVIYCTAIVSGLMMPLLMSFYLFSKKSINIVYLLELIILAIIGFIKQQVTYASSYYYYGFFNEYLGYTLFFPIFGVLMHITINHYHINKKSSILFISAGFSILIHFINFILYPMLGGETGQLYAFMIFEELPYALLFAVLYDIYYIKSMSIMKPSNKTLERNS